MFKEILNKLISVVPMLSISVGAVGDYRGNEIVKYIRVGTRDYNYNSPSVPAAIINTYGHISRDDNKRWEKLGKEIANMLGIKTSLESAGLKLCRTDDDNRFLLRMSNAVKVYPADQRGKVSAPLLFDFVSIVFPDSLLKNIKPNMKHKFLLSELLAEMNRKWPEKLDKTNVDMPYVCTKTKSGQRSCVEFVKYIENPPFDMTIAEAIVDFIYTKGFEEYEKRIGKTLFRKMIPALEEEFAAMCKGCFQGSSSSSSNQPPSTKIRLVPASLVPEDNVNASSNHESHCSSPDYPPGCWDDELINNPMSAYYDSLIDPELAELMLRLSMVNGSFIDATDASRWCSSEDRDDPRGSLPRLKRPRQDSVSRSPIKRNRVLEVSDDTFEAGHVYFV